MQIKIESNPSQQTIEQLGIDSWSIWEKENSNFPWTYDMEEVCYILEGEATIQPESGEAVTITAGDLVTFPQGMNCHWHITKPIRKHYLFR